MSALGYVVAFLLTLGFGPLYDARPGSSFVIGARSAALPAVGIVLSIFFSPWWLIGACGLATLAATGRLIEAYRAAPEHDPYAGTLPFRLSIAAAYVVLAGIVGYMDVTAGQPVVQDRPIRIIVSEQLEPLSSHLNVTIDILDAPRSGVLIEKASEQILAFGQKRLRENPTPELLEHGITFWINGSQRTGMGPSGRGIAHISYDDQEMRQSVHMGATPESILDAAHEAGHWSSWNDAVISDYCGHGSRADGAFCQGQLGSS